MICISAAASERCSAFPETATRCTFSPEDMLALAAASFNAALAKREREKGMGSRIAA
jgi:hypothetical protein